MTDRTLTGATDLDALAFDARGLVPVVVQDASSCEVLMLGWADREALEQTLETGQMHFWSRSRERLWKKGETSGNVLDVVALHHDCDADAVLARVKPTGPTCHTGERTCFGEGAGSAPRGTRVLDDLWTVLDHRARERPTGSYTARLLEDDNLRLKKLGEETAELLVALASNDLERIPEEAADLLYHVLVAIRGAGVDLGRVLKVLEKRQG